MLMMNLGNGYYIDVSQVKMVGSLSGSSKVLPQLMETIQAKGPEWVINTCRGRKRMSLILMNDGTIFLSHRKAKTVVKNIYLAMMNQLLSTQKDISVQPLDQAFYNVMLQMTLDVYSDIKTEARAQQQRSGKIYAMPPIYQEGARNYRDELHPDFAEQISMDDIMQGIRSKFDERLAKDFEVPKPPWDEDEEEEDEDIEGEEDDLDDEEEEDDE